MARVVAKFAVTITLLALLLWDADFSGILLAAAQIRPYSMVAGFAVLLGLGAVQAARWRTVVMALGGHLSFRSACHFVLLGFLFSQLLPSSIGGDAARIWKLHGLGTTLQKALNSVILDRAVALLAALLITAACASLILELFQHTAAPYVLAAVVLAVALGFLFLAILTRGGSRDGAPALRGRNRFARALGIMARDAAAVFLSARALGVTVALSCLTHIAVSAVVWLLAVDAGARLDLLTCVAVVPTVMVLSMLPVSIAGWGIREGAMIVALGAAGVDKSTALTTSMVYGLLLAATAVPGALLWFHDRQRW